MKRGFSIGYARSTHKDPALNRKGKFGALHKEMGRAWRTEENAADPFRGNRLGPKVPTFGGHRNQAVTGRVPTHAPSGFGPFALSAFTAPNHQSIFSGGHLGAKRNTETQDGAPRPSVVTGCKSKLDLWTPPKRKKRPARHEAEAGRFPKIMKRGDRRVACLPPHSQRPAAARYPLAGIMGQPDGLALLSPPLVSDHRDGEGECLPPVDPVLLKTGRKGRSRRHAVPSQLMQSEVMQAGCAQVSPVQRGPKPPQRARNGRLEAETRGDGGHPDPGTLAAHLPLDGLGGLEVDAADGATPAERPGVGRAFAHGLQPHRRSPISL